jgi:hypothetical protein
MLGMLKCFLLLCNTVNTLHQIWDCWARRVLRSYVNFIPLHKRCDISVIHMPTLACCLYYFNCVLFISTHMSHCFECTSSFDLYTTIYVTTNLILIITVLLYLHVFLYDIRNLYAPLMLGSFNMLTTFLISIQKYVSGPIWLVFVAVYVGVLCYLC